MRRTCLALAALSLPLAATPARAGIVEVEPSSPWNVDFAENKCRLARFFGEGENRHLLFFEQYWPDARVGLTAAGPGFRRFGSLQRTELKFFESQEPRETKPFAGKVANYGDAVVFSTLPMSSSAKPDEADPSTSQARIPSLDKAYARQVEFVSLKQRGDEVRLMTGPLEAAFEVLDSCALDLIGTGASMSSSTAPPPVCRAGPTGMRWSAVLSPSTRATPLRRGNRALCGCG